LQFLDDVQWARIEMLEHELAEFIVAHLARAEAFDPQADRVRFADRVRHLDHDATSRD
jgi:hypothetical protein